MFPLGGTDPLELHRAAAIGPARAVRSRAGRLCGGSRRVRRRGRDRGQGEDGGQPQRQQVLLSLRCRAVLNRSAGAAIPIA